MKKTKVIFLTLCTFFMFLLAGCIGIKHESRESEDNSAFSGGFTERQKELIKIKGWPADVDQLDTDQETEIYMTELCMQYIEKKYPDDKFEYVEYLGLGSIGERSAYGIHVKSEKYKDIEPITVDVSYSEKKHKDVFWDNYEVTIAMCELRNDIEKKLEDKKPGVQIKTYMYTKVIRDGKTMETDDNWHEPVVLFTTNVFSGPEDVEQTMREIAENLLKQYDEEMVWFEFVVFDEEDFENVEPSDNFGNDYLSGRPEKPKGIYYYDCIVKEGIVDIERWD